MKVSLESNKFEDYTLIFLYTKSLKYEYIKIYEKYKIKIAK